MTAFKLTCTTTKWAALALIGSGLVACSSTPLPPPETAPTAQACPAGVPEGMKCLRGVDSANAHYLIVMPPKWSGVLVVHAHGGPSLGEPKASRADEDIKRWSITVREGHAWAGSVFRVGGFAVRTASEDTERVRRIFVDHVAKPKRTLLHGQSWGASVAARAAELFPQSWDGMLLTSGVVAGSSTYDFRLDLRVIYQHVCKNHPQAHEPQYPLNLGLPKDSALTRADLDRRVEDCLALRKPAAQRTPEQTKALETITGVVRIPAASIPGHLNWATWSLQDLVEKSGGASPLGNQTVQYRGSADDSTLNHAVLRFTPDPKAKARFEADIDHAGQFSMPVISAHGVRDSTVFVESQDQLKARMTTAGTSGRLVQAFVDSPEHSYWGDEMYPPLFNSLLKWVETGSKPSPLGIAEMCNELAVGKAGPCRFLPDYVAKPMASRFLPR